jgi:hypothetical protein
VDLFLRGGGNPNGHAAAADSINDLRIGDLAEWEDRAWVRAAVTKAYQGQTLERLLQTRRRRQEDE